jgi:hypothetical protein
MFKINKTKVASYVAKEKLKFFYFSCDKILEIIRKNLNICFITRGNRNLIFENYLKNFIARVRNFEIRKFKKFKYLNG